MRDRHPSHLTIGIRTLSDDEISVVAGGTIGEEEKATNKKKDGFFNKLVGR